MKTTASAITPMQMPPSSHNSGMTYHSVDLAFSSLSLHFDIPSDAVIPNEFEKFRTSGVPHPDASYTIELLHTPLSIHGTMIHSSGSMDVYQTHQGQLRVYRMFNDTDRCQVACLLCPDGNHKLYYPASRWQFYASPLRCLPFLAIEQLLIRRNAFLLHSSVIAVHGQAILFVGASGTGKSTQAELWKRHRHASIVNGDRCIVMRKENCFFGGGSPWSGTSSIYDPAQYPLRAVILPQKAELNQIERIGPQAFSTVLQQTLVNSWDNCFMQTLLSLYNDLFLQIPAYRLSCRPEKEAVDLLYNTLFTEGDCHAFS